MTVVENLAKADERMLKGANSVWWTCTGKPLETVEVLFINGDDVFRFNNGGELVKADGLTLKDGDRVGMADTRAVILIKAERFTTKEVWARLADDAVLFAKIDWLVLNDGDRVRLIDGAVTFVKTDWLVLKDSDGARPAVNTVTFAATDLLALKGGDKVRLTDDAVTFPVTDWLASKDGDRVRLADDAVALADTDRPALIVNDGLKLADDDASFAETAGWLALKDSDGARPAVDTVTFVVIDLLALKGGDRVSLTDDAVILAETDWLALKGSDGVRTDDDALIPTETDWLALKVDDGVRMASDAVIFAETDWPSLKPSDTVRLADDAVTFVERDWLANALKGWDFCLDNWLVTFAERDESMYKDGNEDVLAILAIKDCLIFRLDNCDVAFLAADRFEVKDGDVLWMRSETADCSDKVLKTDRPVDCDTVWTTVGLTLRDDDTLCLTDRDKLSGRDRNRASFSVANIVAEPTEKKREVNM